MIVTSPRGWFISSPSPSFLVIVPFLTVRHVLISWISSTASASYTLPKPRSGPCLRLSVSLSHHTSSLSLPLIYSPLTCQSLLEIGHFLWFIKVAFHLYQDVHVLHHQFLSRREREFETQCRSSGGTCNEESLSLDRSVREWRAAAAPPFTSITAVNVWNQMRDSFIYGASGCVSF